MSLVVALAAFCSWADTEEVGGVKWSYYPTWDDSEGGYVAVVTGASPTSGALDIPSELGGYPVRVIGDRAFMDCNDLTSVAMFSGMVIDSLLPAGEVATVSKGKWLFAKAASVKWAKPKKGSALPEIYDEASGKGLIIDVAKGKTNLSVLKLTYTPKTGMFKGSFKVYELQGSGAKTKLKSYTVNVNGAVVGGVGYGIATCKKPAISWSVTVK